MRRLSRQPRHLQRHQCGTGEKAAASWPQQCCGHGRVAARRVVGARAPRAARAAPAHHAPQFKQMHDAMRAAAAEVQFEPPEPRPERQSKRTDPYGNYTKVLGLETCAAFRAANPIIWRFAPAGLFNSATNALWQTILSNCRVSEHGQQRPLPPALGQAQPRVVARPPPWPTCSPNSSALGWRPRMASVLPVVTVKDPLTWFPSICRHPYAVRLSSKQRTKCPRPLDAPVSVAFQRAQVVYYDNLVDLWWRWHGEYYQAAWPRLLVRFEDLLFEPRAVAGAVCDCLGGALCGNQPVRRRGRAPRRRAGVASMAWRTTRRFERAVKF